MDGSDGVNVNMGISVTSGDSDKYTELLNIIEDVEASAPQKETTFIEASNFESAPEPAETKEYSDLVNIIELIEEGKRPAKEMPERKAAPALPHLITSGIEQTRYSYAKPQPQTPQQIQQPKQKAAVSNELLKKQKDLVAKELGSIAGKLTSFKPKFELELKRRKIKVSDLVLPSLSLADQISEIERIIEGLRERVFDKEHMDIVTQEIYGMEEAVQYQKKLQEQKGIVLSSLEKSLWDLRDQRISEAVSLIKGAS